MIKIFYLFFLFLDKNFFQIIILSDVELLNFIVMLSFNFSKNPELLMPHLIKVCREVYGLRINAEEVSPVKVMFVLKRRAVLFASNRKYYGIAVILSDDQVAVYEYSGNVGLFKKSDFAVLKIKN